MIKKTYSPSVTVASGPVGAYNFCQFARRGLVHGSFGRRGGVSCAPYNSLNIGYHVGDDSLAVAANREIIKKSLGLDILVSARQVHGAKVHLVKSAPVSDQEIEAVDGLISDCSVGLMIQQADCQAVIFYDPQKRAIGICHAGWRGSVANIIAATVAAMQTAFTSQPVDIIAAISPALGPCCAEFSNYKQELPEAFHKYEVGKNHFDFIAISRNQLRATGIRADNISVADICTRCDTDFFSYRRHKTTGRSCTVIGLQP